MSLRLRSFFPSALESTEQPPVRAFVGQAERAAPVSRQPVLGEMRAARSLVLALALVGAAFAEEEEVVGAETYKVNNLLKRQDLGSPSREDVVAALLEAEGNAGKAAV